MRIHWRYVWYAIAVLYLALACIDIRHDSSLGLAYFVIASLAYDKAKNFHPKEAPK